MVRAGRNTPPNSSVMTGICSAIGESHQRIKRKTNHNRNLTGIGHVRNIVIIE